ncbi:MAG TPA: winged helix-turn-helix domain-containing protein [Rhizobiaceae bacterium]|nr:winged helix-turn-helix domain-containing protein [Rhizobiaceae bacterium]
MRDGPDIAKIASLVGDPARANMLTALLDGGALTASELALEAGVGLPTASSHLAKLTEGGLLTLAAQGRHRYYSLAGRQVAAMLESIMGVASAVGPKRTRPGPRDAAMREARVCYDHLAGERAVAMLDRFLEKKIVKRDGDALSLGKAGPSFFEAVGIDTAGIATPRRPMCRACLDWSVRRSHLAGALGAAILDKVIAEKWARRPEGSRVVEFTPPGRTAFEKAFLSA